MANETDKTILFSIKLDTADIIVKQAALAKEIENGKNKLNDLKKAAGEGTVEFQKQKAELGNLQKEYSNTNKILQTNNEIQKAQKGSINDLRASLAKVTIEYNLLSKEERNNSDIGGKLAKSKLDITNQLKKLEEATGDHRRSVGDYSKALAGTPFGGFIDGISNMGKAFLANPIGLIITAIVLALGALKKAFTSTEEGQDKMAKGFEIISNVVGSLFKIIEPLASFLFDKLASAFEAIGTAAAFAGHAIADALATFGFDGAAKSLNNFVDSTSKAAAAGAKIADLRDESERIERELIVERAKLEARIADATQKAHDIENVSAAERKKAVKEAIDLTNQLANKEEKRAKLLLEAQILENKTTGATKEDKNAQAELEANLFNIQRNRSQDIRALQKAESAGLKDLKAAEKERFDAAQVQIKIEIDLIQQRGKAWADELKKRVDAFNASTKQEADRTKLIEDIEAERAKFIRDVSSETTKQKIGLLDIEHQKQLDGIENEKFLLEQKGLLTLDNQKKLSDDKLKIDQQYEDDKRTIQQASVQTNLAIAQDAINSLKIIAGDNFNAQKGLALLQIGLDEAKSISALIASSTANPLNAVTFGAAGIAQFAAGVVGLAANIAKARQIVNSQEPPKAEHGIILGGESHANGGTEISADGKPIAIAEKGELLTIVNKRSTGMLKNLSNLNQLGGGIPFMERGGIPEFQSGGIALDNDKFSSQNSIVNLLRNLPRPVVAVQHIIEAIGTLTSVENKADI